MKKKVTLKFPSGSKYVGEVKNGEFSGQGTLTRSDGKTLKGQWKNDEFVK